MTVMTNTQPAVRRPPAVKGEASRTRLESIDAVRGIAMILMLLDHLRETWLVLIPVPDPVDAHTVLPALAIARFAASFCASVFVALTGVSAYLFSVSHTAHETTAFLVKRGLLLMAIDVLFLSPLYWGVAPQPTFWLQVIWCLGACMILLAGLIRLPRPARIALGLVLVCGHNLLDPIRLDQGDTLFPIWALLHQRDVIALPFGFIAKTTYPILPWVGVMLLGHAIGPWFARDVEPSQRIRRLIRLGTGMIFAFIALRALNLYGDAPWYVVENSPLRTVISFLSMTKYPPSLLFLLPTLGGGALMLALLDRSGRSRTISALAVFGGAPMFFYLFHLTVLRILYHAALAWWGPTNGVVFMVHGYSWVLAWYVALIIPFYLPTAWFSRLKQRRRDIAWLRFF